jgi:hypothetical protein
MDPLDHYRAVIRDALTAQTVVPIAFGDLRLETVFDREQDRYAVLVCGRDQERRRVNAILLHVDIIDGKIWIQADGTEEGIATVFVAAGIPKEQIVLGFKSPSLRKYSGFAVA